MSDKYKLFDGDEVYFVTIIMAEWIKVEVLSMCYYVYIDQLRVTHGGKYY